MNKIKLIVAFGLLLVCPRGYTAEDRKEAMPVKKRTTGLLAKAGHKLYKHRGKIGWTAGAAGGLVLGWYLGDRVRYNLLPQNLHDLVVVDPAAQAGQLRFAQAGYIGIPAGACPNNLVNRAIVPVVPLATFDSLDQQLIRSAVERAAQQPAAASYINSLKSYFDWPWNQDIPEWPGRVR